MPAKFPITQYTFDDVTIGSGNGLVLSDKKTLPQPMLTHITSLGHNDLTYINQAN